MKDSAEEKWQRKHEITKAFKKINSKKFLKKINFIKNPYFKKNTTDQIVNIIANINLKKIIFKSFIDD